GARAIYHAPPGGEALEAGGNRIVRAEHRQIADGRPNRADEGGPLAGHSERQALDGQDITVAVHDEPGQAVRLAPHEPAQRRPGATQSDRGADTAREEDGVERLVLAREHPAAAGGTRLEEPAAD